MAERFFAINQISFNKNDLPPEGDAHNKALHLTVKCEGYYVKRVMLDGGSRVDICPLSTLQRMEIGTKRIRHNNMCVRAFDGIKRDTIGEIDLILTISSVDFEVTFQVLNMDTSHNFLLGRPWIHSAGAVPSTLHQMVKFEHEDQKIVVHGEDEQSIYRDPSVPCLEAREGSDHIVYQAFEIVVADQYEEGKPCPRPFLSNSSIMVAKEMVRHGYKTVKGIGRSLQGIAEPVTLTASEKFFGVGFRPTPADVKWADDRKNDGWVLPQPMPHLYRTFVMPKYNEEDEAFMVEEIKEICGAMRKILYETHMVQPGEGSSTTEIKEEVTKQLKIGVIQVVRYTTWLANVVPVPKKDGKTRVRVDYRDLNKASPKDNFHLPNIHNLVDNCAKYEIQSFVDCYAGYHQVLMDEEDVEKREFTTPWGTYCYRVMPFGLKNAGATYMRAMTNIFHDMMH
ncbi:uncharacterized protein [Nicotiana sylvestris]|uniref:uncharacterized protein n=1 Tax=Nicotiana sylvestris TaxID=4096 RepID=UPI00388CD2BE